MPDDLARAACSAYDTREAERFSQVAKQAEIGCPILYILYIDVNCPCLLPEVPMFERQGLHLALVALLVLAVAVLAGRVDQGGALFGLPATLWLWFSVGAAIVHQGYVTLAWRAELHHRTITQRFRRNAFILYACGFADLAFWRMLALVLLALANRGVWSLPMGLRLAVSLVLLVPWAWLIVDITRHFGWRRALGSDHFSPVRPALVREGLWGRIENPIYTLGPLVLYLPGLLLNAPLALLSAAFQHAALWVHWYCTELPDMARIYGDVRTSERPNV